MSTIDKATFGFIITWMIWIGLLTYFNNTRIGHVLLYYSFTLMIIYTLVSQYKRLAPLLENVQSISDLNNTTKGQ